MTKIRVISPNYSKGENGDGAGDDVTEPKKESPDFSDGTHLTQRYRSALLNNNYKRNSTTNLSSAPPIVRRSRSDEGYTDSQFQKPPAKVPKKSIFLALFLFVCGSTLLVIGLSSWWMSLGMEIEMEVDGRTTAGDKVDTSGPDGPDLGNGSKDPSASSTDRILPMILIGFLMFIPGFYHVRIAYYAYLGVAGYDFEMIPECDMFG